MVHRTDASDYTKLYILKVLTICSSRSAHKAEVLQKCSQSVAAEVLTKQGFKKPKRQLVFKFNSREQILHFDRLQLLKDMEEKKS